MKSRAFEATYVIKIKGSGGGDHNSIITSQMLRDKILSSLQEMWLLHHINGFSLEEVETETVGKFEKFERTEKEPKKRKYS